MFVPEKLYNSGHLTSIIPEGYYTVGGDAWLKSSQKKDYKRRSFLVIRDVFNFEVEDQ
jgi:hypothetical protein